MRLKKIIGLVHLWVGLVAGFIVSIVGLTGAIYVFAPEIEARPYNLRVQATASPATPLLPPEEIIARYEQAYGKRLHMFMNQRRAQKFYVLWLKDPKEEIFVNPYTGDEILRTSQERSSFWTWLVGIHMNLGLGTVGKYINGTASFLLAVVIISSGIYLWWPKNKRTLKRALTIRWNVSWKRKNYDLHNVGGWYTHAVIGLLAFTGACFTFPDLGPDLLNVLFRAGGPARVEEAGIGVQETGSSSPAREAGNPAPGRETNARIRETGGPAGETGIPEDQPPKDFPLSFAGVAEAASRLYPEYHLMHIVYDQGSPDPVVVTKTNHKWISPGKYIRTYTYLDPSSGEVLRQYDPRTASPGEKITAYYKRQVHYGEIGGWATRILAFLAGMFLPVLYITGIMIWYNRTRGKKRAKSLKTGRGRQDRKYAG